MTARRLSDHEIKWLAVDYMPADIARKFIEFMETTDFDADATCTTEPTIDPYFGKLFCLLAAVQCPTQH